MYITRQTLSNVYIVFCVLHVIIMLYNTSLALLDVPTVYVFVKEKKGTNYFGSKKTSNRELYEDIMMLLTRQHWWTSLLTYGITGAFVKNAKRYFQNA